VIPDLPYRPRAEIEAVQQENFARTIALAVERHPYLRDVMAERGLAPGDLSTLADLPKLPLLFKTGYMADPDRFRLDCAGLEDEEARVVWDTMHTTGTTNGRPTPFVSTTWDFYNTLTANRRALEIRGVTRDDVVANLCPMTVYPYGAYHRTIAACSAMKIPVVSLMPGRPSPRFHWGSGLDEVVETVARTRCTILWGVASYVRRVIQHAEAAGADFSAVRLAFLMGEPVTDAMREDTERRLQGLGAGEPKVNVSYAATEMQVGAVECRPGSGYHNPAPEEFFFEVVDPQTHAPLADGERGLVVMTHLNRRGTLLLRYALGDTSVLSRERCPHCGAWTDRFVELPHRADDMIKVKGMLVNPGVLSEALQRVANVVEHQTVVDREDPSDALSMDAMTVRLAVGPGADGAAAAAAAAEAVKRAVGVRPRVEIVAREEIYDPDRTAKSKRLIDRRR